MPIQLNLVALGIFIFGAYAYGSVILLSLRHGPQVWSGPPGRQLHVVSFLMYAVCTLWFVLQSVIEFRYLLGNPRNDDMIDLASLEVVFWFPALIFHTVVLESRSDQQAARIPTPSLLVLTLLYGWSLAMGGYFPARILGYVGGPTQLGPYIGLAIVTPFTVASIASIAVMLSRPPKATTADERRLRGWMVGLFVLMTGVFVVLAFQRQRQALIQLLDLGVRMAPLAFLLVSVYFENRIQFYDLIIKRGVRLLLSLLTLGAALAATLHLVDRMPAGALRPWIFAVVLVPAAMALPWLHDRAGRLLDRLWFGREFTPVEAIKHVLGAMQQATDEASLAAAAERTLSEMFRRRVRILLGDQATPDDVAVVVTIESGASPTPIRMAVVHDPRVRALLSEDLALLRSLGSVFGFMLENVRLQSKRQEQEQVAHQLRLQTSRSELKALRAQINPHFLFNALNAIASLIHTDPARADLAVEQLAEVFRYTLRRSEQEWAPLDQELALAQAYLDVEQARFGRRLDYAVEADPGAGRAQVPSMLLQTLVENAVKHGISRLRTPGRIDVRARLDGRRLTLEVRDTGPGPEAVPTRHAASGESFGLRNVRDRLDALFGRDASFALVRENDGTIARMDMPLVEQPQPAAGAVR